MNPMPAMSRRGNKREAISQVACFAADQANAPALPLDQDPKSVVPDFMNPLGADWRPFCRAGKTWLEGGLPAG
jgi:hypothetical protein